MILTEYRTIKMSDLFPRTQTERRLSIEKVKTAACRALNKAMIAVVEYWHGYLLPICDWRRNQDDQQIVPANNATEPIVHLSLPTPGCINTCRSIG